MAAYITPAMLTAYPTGISWDTLVQGGNSQAQTAEQQRMCQRSSDAFDIACNQPVRAGQTTETLTGPDWRVTIANTGMARVQLSRRPVLSIGAVQYGIATANPQTLTAIPSTAYYLSYSVYDNPLNILNGVGQGNPQSLLITPGFVTWLAGRNGYLVEVQYVHGFPHAALTASASMSGTSLVVDECAGWALGTTPQVRATIYDGASTETVTVTAASAAAGPGTLTCSALAFAHSAGVLVSTLPEDVQVACIKKASSFATQRGLTAAVAVAGQGRSQPGGILAQQKQWDADFEDVASHYRAPIY